MGNAAVCGGRLAALRRWDAATVRGLVGGLVSLLEADSRRHNE